MYPVLWRQVGSIPSVDQSGSRSLWRVDLCGSLSIYRECRLCISPYPFHVFMRGGYLSCTWDRHHIKTLDYRYVTSQLRHSTEEPILLPGDQFIKRGSAGQSPSNYLPRIDLEVFLSWSASIVPRNEPTHLGIVRRHHSPVRKLPPCKHLQRIRRRFHALKFDKDLAHPRRLSAAPRRPRHFHL